MKIKAIVFTSFLTIIIGVLLVFSVMEKSEAFVANSGYLVYLDGKKIGFVSEDKDLYNLIDEDQTEIKEKYNVDNVYPPNGLEVIKTNTYNSKINSAEEIYDQIKDHSSFTVKGYIITILPGTPEEEEKKIYVLDYETFRKSAETIVTTFIDAKDYTHYLKKTQPEIIDVGEKIDTVYFQEEKEDRLIIKEGNISTDELIFTDSEELTRYLLFGSDAEQETYIVKQGDTIETIAYNHQLNTQEFLIANPRFTNSANLLAVGEPVTITLINPVLTFVYEMTVIEDTEIDYESETVQDITKSPSYRFVTQSGQKGITRIESLVQYVNGEISQGGYIREKTVLKEPVKEIITRGRQNSTSGNYIDTNQTWAWPTNQPYILSSGYAYRWGSFHDAIDITGTGYGSPIYAALGGTVFIAENGHATLGNYIIINHHNNYYTMYAHLSKILVSEGQSVARAQRIGQMGNTGNVVPRPTPANPIAGTHLHFGVWVGGAPYRGGSHIDPWRLYK